MEDEEPREEGPGGWGSWVGGWSRGEWDEFLGQKAGVRQAGHETGPGQGNLSMGQCCWNVPSETTGKLIEILAKVI